MVSIGGTLGTGGARRNPGARDGLFQSPGVPVPSGASTVEPMSRTVQSVTTAHRQTEGAGFVVRRPFPTRGLDAVDPFLLLDELGPIDYAAGEATGAPDHPHRGFETVSYIL